MRHSDHCRIVLSDRLLGAHDQGIAAGQRALACATASGDVVLYALANQHLGNVYEGQNDYRRAIDFFGETVACLEGALRCERHGQIFLPAVQSRALLARCHAELGTFAKGEDLGDEGLRIAEEVEHPASLMIALLGIGELSLRQGDLRRALPRLERSISICREADLASYFTGIAAALGAAYTLAGRVADAVPLLTQAVEQSGAGVRPKCLISLSEVYLLAERHVEACTRAEHALELVTTSKSRGMQAWILRLLGDIVRHRDPPDIDHAETHYQQALALADELGMRPLQAHCHRGLGTLYGMTGQREQAQTALSTAMAMYQSMEMTFWLPQTEAALAQIEGQ